MKSIDEWLDEYSDSHQNQTNKFIHWICVPLIFFTIVGFISLIPAPHFCAPYFGCISIASIVALVLVSIFYFNLSWRISIIMLLIMLLLEHFAYAINVHFKENSWIIYLSIFVITWIFQFIGHKIEGKKPSFLKDLQFLLVGPIWLLHFILKKIGIPY